MVNFRYDDLAMKTHPISLLILLSVSLIGCSNLATQPAEKAAGETAPPQVTTKTKGDVVKNTQKTKAINTRKKSEIYVYSDYGLYDDPSELEFLFANPEEQCNTLFSPTATAPWQEEVTLEEEPPPHQAPKLRKRSLLSSVKKRDLWCRIRDGYQLQFIDNEYIQQALGKYIQSPHYFENLSLKARPYLYHIVKEIEKRRMPLELALLPAIESGYEPLATSSKSAAGIWQFIPETGKDYGLAQTMWYDGRRDFINSTQAALDYLKRLYELFNGDWLIALAAYNYGEGHLRKAISKNESEGKPTDFWSLELPSETRWYIPKLLALAKVVANPQTYGIKLVSIPDTPYLVQVEVDSQISLPLAARFANLSTTDLARLNAGYRLAVTAPEGPQKLTLPIHKVEKFKQRLAQTPPSARLSLPDVEAQIKLASQILSASQPTPEEVKLVSQSLEDNAFSQHHRVSAGESLSGIAKRYGTTVAKLRQLNNLTGPLKIGQSLTINQPSSQTSELEEESPKKKVIYTVKSGDSLATIARDYRVSVGKLTQWNSLQKNSLRLGQKLTIWLDS